MKHLDLTVFEPGDTVGTVSADGRVLLWKINADGQPVSASDRILDDGTDADTPIEALHLTVRSFNCLKREAINTVGELLRFHEEKGDEGFLNIRNFGEKNLAEIHEHIERIKRAAS